MIFYSIILNEKLIKIIILLRANVAADVTTCHYMAVYIHAMWRTRVLCVRVRMCAYVISEIKHPIQDIS